MLPKGQVFLVIVFLLLAWPNTASAHADLLLSDPAAGGIYPVGYLSKVSLQFNEVLESSISSIEVYNSSMERMDVGDIQLDSTDDHILLVDLPELGLDTYTVVWSVVSKIDGHSTTGLFTFIIGPENEDSFTSANIASASSKAIMSPWEAGIRWVLFSTAFVIFGAFLLSPIVLEPSLKNKIEFKDLWPKVNQALDSLIFKALFLWLLAGFALLIWRSSVIGSKDLFDVLASGIPIQLLNTRFGIVWLLRQLLASWLLVLHWRSRNSHILFKLTLAAGLLGSLSLTSHNAANALWPITSTIIDWLHLLANGAWIGGLLALTLTFYPALRTLPKDERMDVGVATMRRFSPLALGSVLVAAMTGVFSASLHILEPEDLVGTPYSWTLLIKVSLVVLVLIFGWANTLTLEPNWISRLFPNIRIADRLGGKLSKMIQLESLIGLLILLVTALLTTMPTPPPQPIPKGQQLPSNSLLREINLPEDRLKVFFTLAPNWTGWNRYLIVLQDDTRNPISDAERVRLRFYLPKADTRTDWRNAFPAQDGLYVTSGQELILVGDWQIEIDIQRSGLADVRFTIDWLMEPPPAFIVDPAHSRLVNFLALASIGLCLVVPTYWVSRYFPREVFSKNRM